MAAVSSTVDDDDDVLTATAGGAPAVSGVTFLYPPLDLNTLYAVGDAVWALQDGKPFASAMVETTLAPPGDTASTATQRVSTANTTNSANSAGALGAAGGEDVSEEKISTKTSRVATAATATGTVTSTSTSITTGAAAEAAGVVGLSLTEDQGPSEPTASNKATNKFSGRLRVRYGDGSAYHCRPQRLIKIYAPLSSFSLTAPPAPAAKKEGSGLDAEAKAEVVEGAGGGAATVPVAAPASVPASSTSVPAPTEAAPMVHGTTTTALVSTSEGLGHTSALNASASGLSILPQTYPHNTNPRNKSDDGQRGRQAAAVLACPETKHYRQLARTQPGTTDRVLEIGSDFGITTAILASATKGEVIGIDKSAKHVRKSRDTYQHIRFECMDILSRPEELQGLGNFDMVFMDINGNRMLPHVLQAIQILQRLTPAPRLLVVKSTELYKQLAAEERERRR